MAKGNTQLKVAKMIKLYGIKNNYQVVDGRWKQMYTARMTNFGQMQPQIT